MTPDRPLIADEILINTIRAIKPDVQLIYFFGSRSNGQEHSQSDWDLAVMCSHKLTPLERFECANKMANTLNAEVDWVDLLEASTVLQMQIIQQGRVLLNNGAQDTFENQVFAMYAELQESRAAIMKDFVEDLTNG